MRISYLILALVTVLLFGSCSKSEWWVGTWHIDVPYTQQHLVDSIPAPPKSNRTNDIATSMQGMAEGLAKGMVPLLLSVLGSTDLVITKNEIIMMKDGAGKAKSYTLFERTSENSVILKVENDLTTYTLEGDYMSTTISGIPNAKIYLKRVK